MLVVDDGSPDGTADVAEILGKELGRHRGAAPAGQVRARERLPGRVPVGPRPGFDACVEMDADLSHEPEALPSLVAPLAEGNELVIGSRYIPGGIIPNWAWHRHLLSRGGNLYASTVLGLKVADATAGFRAYAASLLAASTSTGPGRGLRVPDRDDLPGQAGRGARPRGADPVRRPGGGRVQDVLVHRGRGARPRHLVGPRAATRAFGRNRGAPAPTSLRAAPAAGADGSAGIAPSAGAGGDSRSPSGAEDPSDRHEHGRGAVMTIEAPAVRILVVDDEPNIAELLSAALAFEGFQSTWRRPAPRPSRGRGTLPTAPRHARRDAARRRRQRGLPARCATRASRCRSSS